jgi:predicted anti-sigma-YlaC factor YlaD
LKDKPDTTVNETHQYRSKKEKKMNTYKKTVKMEDMKAKLSTLWVVVMFNLLAADVLSLYIPGALEEMAEFAGEIPITQLMLGGAIMMEIAIAMIFLSRVLKYRANRWANIIASVITIAYVIGGGSTYPHYIFFATIEIMCMLLIVWYAWKWPKQEA